MNGPRPVSAETWLLLLGLLCALLAGLWVWQNTEWVEVPSREPATGEAARDPLYAAKRIAERLGAQVVAPQGLDVLPPPGATLVLGGFRGSLLPESRAAVERWVRAGGQLVVPSWFVDANDETLGWLPMRRGERPNHDEEGTDDAPMPAPEPAGEKTCPKLHEPADAPPAFGARRAYRVCMNSELLLESDDAPLWALNDDDGHVWLRVPYGRGSVTAIGNRFVMNNRQVLQEDHALAMAAALQLHDGAQVWFLDAESRPPLLALIWQHGAPAVGLGALALLLALWRAAVRFGPPVAPAPLARRSVAEQVRHTAAFIFRGGGAALHRAAVRALLEAAASRLPAAPGRNPAQLAQAIAGAAALDPAALERALDLAHPPPRRELPGTLALLETARRRLLARRPS